MRIVWRISLPHWTNGSATPDSCRIAGGPAARLDGSAPDAGDRERRTRFTRELGRTCGARSATEQGGRRHVYVFSVDAFRPEASAIRNAEARPRTLEPESVRGE